jgi:hypothetical protein
VADFALLGTPDAVVGALKVTNNSDAPQTVQEVLVRDPTAGVDDLRLAVVSTEIAAQSTVEVQVGLRMLPDTAPGEYPLEIVVLGETHDGSAFVTEQVVAAVSPARVVVLNKKTKQKKMVMLLNRGNVDLQVHSPGPVPIYRERDVTADAVNILSGTADPDGGTSTNGAPTPSGELKAEIKGSPVTVAPGDVAALEVGITVKDGLDQSTRHLAEIPLSVTDLVVVVTPAP